MQVTKKLQHCAKCHYPQNHPLGLILKDGVCTGCITHREKNSIKWEDKFSELEQLLKKYRKQHSTYDCVVPVVGDAEDFYTLSRVLSFGLSPLVVCVNDYFKNNIGWHNIHQLITYFDVDSIVFNPDIRIYKELIRTSLRKFDHVMLPFLQLHTSFPVHIAYEREIPLVIWGQNQSVEQVGKFSHNDAVEMNQWYRKQHDLFNVQVSQLIGNGAQLSPSSLNYYEYPSAKKLSQRGVKGIYLSNYLRWDPLGQNSEMTKYGFIPETNLATFDIYERTGSSVYYHFHDLLKFKRTGYRKISDHVAREIRHGRLDVEEGQKIASDYSNTKVHIKPFFDWLGTSESGYKWFKSHRLSDVEHLISETPVPEPMFALPKTLNDNLQESQVAEKQFIVFGKGVSI